MSLEFRLEAAFSPLADARFGRLKLTLVNLSARPLSGFTLCYSALTRAARGATCINATLVRRVANFHEFAPPAGLTLASGESWAFCLEGLTHQPKHRLDGPKAAYLSFAGSTFAVETGDLRTDSAMAGPLRVMPEGRVEIPLSVMPWPNQCAVTSWHDAAPVLVPQAGSGTGEMATMARIAALSQRLFPATPAPFALTGPGLELAFATDANMGKEAYQLEFRRESVKLTSGEVAGHSYGLITLAQIAQGAVSDPDNFRFPETGFISDAPRYGWRGAHLDVARHFWPVADVLRFLDILAWLKLNVFQWHLTDDEGWRLEIKALPELTRVGAWRGAGLALLPQHGSGPGPYGGLYTQDQVRRIVARASALQIEIVPEIDIPGHCTAVLKSLPHLVDPHEPPDSYRSIQGYPNNALNPGIPATFDFLETVLGEVAALFPGRFIHVGADEVDAASWRQSPRAQALLKAENLADTSALQAYLLRRVQGMLGKLGKNLAGWDEVSHGGGVALEGTLLVAWQKPEVIARLAGAGYDVVASPGQAYYLDMVQAEGWDEPGTSWAGVVSPQACYDYEAAGDLPAAAVHRLKGVQACIWSEHLTSKELFNHMVFPRLGAVAEAGWTAKEHKSWTRFARLAKGLPEL